MYSNGETGEVEGIRSRPAICITEVLDIGLLKRVSNCRVYVLCQLRWYSFFFCRIPLPTAGVVNMGFTQVKVPMENENPQENEDQENKRAPVAIMASNATRSSQRRGQQ